MENTVKWSGVHTASDGQNFLVVAHHLGIPEEDLLLPEGDPS